MIGSCAASALIFDSTKYGPPITTYAICATVAKSPSKTLAKPTEENIDLKFQAEIKTILDKLTKEQEEYIRIIQENKAR